MAVSQELEKLNVQTNRINLGEVELQKPLTIKQIQQLTERLNFLGFELLDDLRQRQIEKVKNILIKKIQSGSVEEHFSISDYLSKSLLKDYSSVSRLFSQVEGITVEQFFILQRIEKVKEWLAYGELTLNEISYKLGYSSIGHLSAQFKKVTGLTPSHFKKIGSVHRHPLDKVNCKQV